MYRHVFALRHEVFTHRPIADSQGVLSPEDQERFRLQCNGVCTTLLMFMCILQPAILEETGQLQLAPYISSTSVLLLYSETMSL